MNTAVFASFIVFCVWFTYKLNKAKKKGAEQEQDFWEMELRANNTRRQPLDDLEYISIPFESLPFDALSDQEKVVEYHEALRVLAERPIVNLSCITNTELKLKYGAPNITLLSRYDSAYTVLARTLQHWGADLYEAGLIDEARQVLEFAVQTKTDVSKSYLLLAKIYNELGTPEKVAELVAVAEGLNSEHGKRIVKKLAGELEHHD
jgi:hypothetical protein